MIGDWRNMYLRPYRMQNVMTAYLAVMLLIPFILFIFSIVSFTQEGQIRDVRLVDVSVSTVDLYGASSQSLYNALCIR